MVRCWARGQSAPGATSPIEVASMISPLSSFQCRQAVPQLHQCLPGDADLTQSVLSHPKISLGLAAPLSSRLAQYGRYQALFLQPLQRRINAAQGHLSAGLLFNLPRDGNTISILTQPHQRQHHYQLEIAQITRLGHFFNYDEEIIFMQTKKSAPKPLTI